METEKARSIILTHARSRRNGDWPRGWTEQANMVNPICGDQVELRMKSDGARITEVGFSAKACAICSASASLLCEIIAGHSRAQAFSMVQEFETTLCQSPESAWPLNLKKLECFSHLRVNPTRKTCALLPWVTMRKLVRLSETV